MLVYEKKVNSNTILFNGNVQNDVLRLQHSPCNNERHFGIFSCKFQLQFFVILQCTALVESLFLACDGKRCFSINSREKIWGTCQEVKPATPSDLDAQSVDWDNDCQAICRSR